MDGEVGITAGCDFLGAARARPVSCCALGVAVNRDQALRMKYIWLSP